MPAGRPSTPRELERAVLVEAGHRCAIPTCRSTTVEIAHIKAYAKGGPTTFDNLIALCPTCHTQFDKGQIDAKAMRQYKAKLALLAQSGIQAEGQPQQAVTQPPPSLQLVINHQAAPFADQLDSLGDHLEKWLGKHPPETLDRGRGRDRYTQWHGEVALVCHHANRYSVEVEINGSIEDPPPCPEGANPEGWAAWHRLNQELEGLRRVVEREREQDH